MTGLTINTNTGTLNTVRNLSMMQRSMKKTMSKLSSGLRINNAADDPAGLVISEQMRSQIGSIAQRITNLDNVINKNKTADSYLMQMEDSLVEMREIAVAATSTGYVDESMVSAYETVLGNAAEAFNRTAQGAAFGKTRLLDGSEGSVAEIEALANFDLSDSEQAQEALARIDGKIAEIHEVHGRLGAESLHEFQSMRDSLAVTHINLTEAESTIRDADMALVETQFLAQKLKIEVSTALLAQGHLVSQSVFGLLSA